MARFGVVWVVALGVSAAAACKFEGSLPEEEAEPAQAGNEGETSAGGSGKSSEGGAAPDTPSAPSSVGGEVATGGDAAGQGGQALIAGGGAGAGGEETAASGAGGAPLASECSISDGCEARCQQATGTCQLIDMPFACEFDEYAGNSRELACGELVTVGPVECGGCGPVDVKIYFDGRSCWQGLPDCTLPEFNGVLFRIDD
jgi:hypothetical protein